MKQREIKVKLTLFLAGNSSNSVMAENNLKKFLASKSNINADIKKVNVNEKPQLALKKNILLAPALLIEMGKEEKVIFGNLSDDSVLNSILE